MNNQKDVPPQSSACENCGARRDCGTNCGEAAGCASACGSARTRGLNRRDFFKIGLAAGLLSGCSPALPGLSTPGPTAAPTLPPQWKKVRDIAAPKWMKYAAFHDADFGVLLLTENQVFNTSDIRFTTDGGRTLTAGRTQDNYCRFGLDIVDRRVLWNSGRGIPSGEDAGYPPATGWKHAVSLSADGGQSWTNAAPLAGVGVLHPLGAYKAAAWASHVSFLDAQTGWVASSHPHAAVTTDGGGSWTPLALPAGLTDIAAIHLLDEHTGRLLDFSGRLYATSDAGASWNSQPLVQAEGKMMLPITRAPLNLAAIRFTDSAHGLVAASLMGGGSSFLAVYRTADGGRTWQTEAIPDLLGLPYISRDGKYLTVVDFIMGDKLSLWAYE